MSTDLYINGSEHDFGFSLIDVIQLRNYARSNNFLFSSQLGGCESLRDVEQSRILSADALEISHLESDFAYTKIYESISEIYSDSTKSTPDIFINISNGLMLDSFCNNHVHLRQNLCVSVVPIINRRQLLRNLGMPPEDIISNLHLFQSYISALEHSSCEVYGLSGGLDIHSYNQIKEFYPKKNYYLRLGLFGLSISKDEMSFTSFNKLKDCQNRELLLLKSVIVSQELRYEYSVRRQSHLMNYLLGA